MNILVLWFSLQTGFFPNGTIAMYETKGYYSLDKSFDITMATEIRLFNEIIFIGGKVNIPMWKSNDDYTFFPNSLYSTFYTGLRLAKGKVEFRYTHVCVHPVLPWHKGTNPNYVWETAYDRLSITFQGKVTVCKSR